MVENLFERRGQRVVPTTPPPGLGDGGPPPPPPPKTTTVTVRLADLPQVQKQVADLYARITELTEVLKLAREEILSCPDGGYHHLRAPDAISRVLGD